MIKRQLFLAVLAGSFLFVADAGEIVFFGVCGTIIRVPSSGNIMTSRTETIPYADSFEGWTNRMYFCARSDNWVTLLGDASYVVEDTYTYGLTPPLATKHTLVANLETEGQTLSCAVTGTASHVWVDMLTRIVPSEDAPWDGDLHYPWDDHEFGLALFSNVQSNLVVFGRTNEWTSWQANTSEILLDPSVWRRLTLHLAYPEELSDSFFSVSIDGELVAWPGGEALPGIASASGSGPWLRFAHKPATRAFPGLQFKGIGLIDDLVIDDRYRGPTQATTAGVEQAMAITWPSDYGRRYRVDWCPMLSLSSNTWHTLQGAVTGNGTTNAVFDLKRNTSARFYRVVPLDE
jgi:hypothetical protein